MKEILLSALLSLTITIVYAQNVNIDSLRQILLLDKTTMEEKKEVLKEIIEFYYQNRMQDELMKYERQLVDEHALPDEEKVVHLSTLCYLCSYAGDFTSANQYCQKGLELIISFEDIRDRIKLYMRAGASLTLQGQYNESLPYLLKADSLNKLGGNDELKSEIYSYIAQVHVVNNNYNDASSFLEQSLDILAKTGNEVEIAAKKINLASIYSHSGQVDTAKSIIEEAIVVLERNQEKRYLMRAYFLLAYIFLDLEQLEQGLDMFQRSLNLAEELNALPLILENYMGIANIYYLKELYDNSIEYCEKAMSLIGEVGYTYELEYIYRILYQNYKALQHYELALTSYEQCQIYQDSLFNEEKSKAIQELTIGFQKKEIELENRLLSDQNALLKTRSILFASLSVLLVIGLLVFSWLYLKLKKARQLIKVRNTELIELDKTKNRLFTIIAHDMRNAVGAFYNITGTISFFLNQNQPERIEQITNALEKSIYNLRNLLDNLLGWALSQRAAFPYRPTSISLKQLVLTIYSNIEFWTEKKGIRVKIDIPQKMEVYADENALETIFRNILTNAIKFTNNDGDILIKAYFQESNEQIVCFIQDNGIGMNNEEISSLFSLYEKNTIEGTNGEKGSGIGLMLVNELVDVNKGEIWVESKKGEGSTFFVSLPTKKEPTTG